MNSVVSPKPPSGSASATPSTPPSQERIRRSARESALRSAAAARLGRATPDGTVWSGVEGAVTVSQVESRVGVERKGQEVGHPVSVDVWRRDGRETKERDVRPGGEWAVASPQKDTHAGLEVAQILYRNGDIEDPVAVEVSGGEIARRGLRKENRAHLEAVCSAEEGRYVFESRGEDVARSVGVDVDDVESDSFGSGQPDRARGFQGAVVGTAQRQEERFAEEARDHVECAVPVDVPGADVSDGLVFDESFLRCEHTVSIAFEPGQAEVVGDEDVEIAVAVDIGYAKVVTFRQGVERHFDRRCIAASLGPQDDVERSSEEARSEEIQLPVAVDVGEVRCGQEVER